MRVHYLKLLVLLVVPFCAASQNPLPIFETCTVTISVPILADAAIGYHDGANTAGNNDGGAFQSAGYAVPSVAGPGLNVNRFLILPDLSVIPTNATLTGAFFDLFAYGQIGNYPGHSASTPGGNNCVMERLLAPWTEYSVTWNNQPPAGTSANDVLAVPGTTIPTLDYLSFNVTSLVKNVMTAGVNYGFKMRLVNETVPHNLLVFCSREHPNTAKHPRMTVTYEMTCETTQLPGNEKKNDLSVLLNGPGECVLFFQSPQTESRQFDFCDLSGRNLITAELCAGLSELRVDVSSLPLGMYLIKELSSSPKTLPVKFLVNSK